MRTKWNPYYRYWNLDPDFEVLDMFDDIDGKSPDDAIIVLVEVWENQRYRPLQGGWTIPVTMPNFSDCSGQESIAVAIERGQALPKLILKPGWTWISEWIAQSDISDIPSGEWLYGSSFEAIIEGKTTSAAMSLVRRRRWVRMKQCFTPAAKEEYHRQYALIQSIVHRMEVKETRIGRDYEAIQSYEARRLLSQDELVRETDRIRKEAIAQLTEVAEKLASMREYLAERGIIESQYSKKLDELSKKWIHAGKSSQESEVAGPSDDTIASPEQQGFFYLVSSATYEVSQRLQSFASILSSSLPSDVDALLQEINTIRYDCAVDDGPRLRAQSLHSHAQASVNFASYQTAIVTFRESIDRNMKHLKDSLKSYSHKDETFMELLPRAKIVESEDKSAASPASLLASHKDLWLALTLYYHSASSWEASVRGYQAFVSQQHRLAQRAIARVSSLLQATIQVLAHEQSRAWEEASALLRRASSSSASHPLGAAWKEAKEDESLAVSEAPDEDDPSAPASPVAGPAPAENQFAFPAGFITDSSTYIAISGVVKYALTYEKTFSLRGGSYPRDEPAEWLDGLVLVTFESILHILPPDTRLDGSLAQHRLLSPILSVDISSVQVEPVLVAIPNVSGEVIAVSPKKDASSLPLVTLSQQTAVSAFDSASQALTRGMSVMGLGPSSTLTPSSSRGSLANLMIQVDGAVAWMKIISNCFTDLGSDNPHEMDQQRSET